MTTRPARSKALALPDVRRWRERCSESLRDSSD